MNIDFELDLSEKLNALPLSDDDKKRVIDIVFWAMEQVAPPKTAGVDACRKCGGAMKPGKAMGQTMDCGDEGTCSPAGPGVLIDCMKCERCGWSVTAGVKENDRG